MKNKDFIIENGVLIKYIGAGEEIIVPDEVTSIGNRAFYNCKSLIIVTLPESVIAIEDEAFLYCDKLKSINFDGVQEIGFCAFKDCSKLTQIQFSNNLRKISNWAFAGCSMLERVEIPDSLELFIGTPFSNCVNLKSVVFKGQKCKFLKSTFYGCSSLETLIMPPKSMLDDCAFDGNCLVPDKLTNTLPQLWRHLSDNDLYYNLRQYNECFGYDALSEILIMRLKRRHKLYGYFERFITKQNGGKLARLVLEKVPLKADKSTCLRVAYLLVLFADKVVSNRLVEIYEWIISQKNNEKALQIIKEAPELVKILGIETL